MRHRNSIEESRVQSLLAQLLGQAPRMTPHSVKDFFTTLRYGGEGLGDAAFNWITRTVTHYNPKF